jgi:hypothetical protein
VPDVAQRSVVVIEQGQTDQIADARWLRKAFLHLFFGRKLTRLAGSIFCRRFWAAGS